jgi:glycosyltransferase involved in cell wall biosynthesis
MTPYFSIIIPAYNVENYIHHAIDSIINQKYQDFELIIVDDCSIDNTLNIITGYEEKYNNITVIKHSKNQTQHIARMNGVNIARGKYILFLDGDDSYTEDAFATLSDIIINNPEYDFYEFGYIEKPSCKTVFPFYSGKDRFLAYFTKDDYPVQTIWNKVYESNILKKAFFSMEKLIIKQGVEDIYESIVIAYFLKKTINIKEIIVNYTIGSGVSTTYKDYNKTLEYLTSIKKIISLIQNFLEKTNQNISLDNINYRFLSFTIYWYINPQRNIEEKKKLFLQLPDFFDPKIIMEYLFNHEESYNELRKKLNSVAFSKDYRLGNKLLCPLRKIKRKIIRIIIEIYKTINGFNSNILLNIFFYFNKGKQIFINDEKSILFLAGFDKYGGTRTYVESLFAVLEKSNFKIHFLINKKNINAEGLNLIKDKNINYSNYDYSFYKPVNMLISIIHINKIIKKNKINTTIISEGDCGYYLPCIFLKTQNILIEHTIPGKLDCYRQKIICKINNNTRIICVSNFQKEKTLENWGKHLKNYCSVIYNSSSYDSDFILKNNINLNKKKIITIAHFIDYKNPEMWLSIAKKLTEKYNELEFTWIGDGKELLSYRNIIGENKAIKLLGYRNHEQIKEEYENTFLYLALSKIENLSLAVIDALRAGIPAIVLNTGGLPEVIDSGKCGFVVNSEEEVIEKIETLLTNEELYNNMSKNAVDRYNMLFSKEEWQKNIVSMISK